MNVNNNLLIGLIIGILLVVFIYIIRYNLTKSKCNDLFMAIKILVRQAARWSTAAQQDKNLLIAVLHANYGVGYLSALRDIATDTQIEEATGVNFKKFGYTITKIQDSVTKKMIKLCPEYAPKKTYLTKIGGEG